MSALVDWMRDNMLTCPGKAMTGLDCPGCGMQRSIIALLEGDVLASLKLYPALIPFLITIILLAAYLFNRNARLAAWMRVFYLGTAAIVVLNYLLKLFWLGLH